MRHYTIPLDDTVAVRLTEVCGENPLAYLSALVTAALGMGPCIHPPGLVVHDGIPQCLGCDAFLDLTA